MKNLILRIVPLAFMSLFAAQVQALSLSPDVCGDGSAGTYECWTDATGTPNQPTAAEIEGLVGSTVGLDDVYKAEEPFVEEGVFASSYQTIFQWIEGEDGPSGATITYTGGNIIDCAACYLSVKDGRNAPNLYVFDISGWDGMETIDLSGFWLNTQGGISNIAIWTPSANVPEPAGLGLLGLGLILLAVKRRRS